MLVLLGTKYLIDSPARYPRLFPVLTGNICTMIFKGPHVFTPCTCSTPDEFWREGP